MPVFPEDMPDLDAGLLPDGPGELVATWLDAAIASGARQPHAMTLLTVRPDGTPVGGTLILKDIVDGGYWFATSRRSRKAADLAANPRASMLFYWRESGRQIRITRVCSPRSAQESQADWQERPGYAGEPNPDWQVYALQPTEVEFLQARADRGHVRVEYRAGTDGWTRVELAG